MAEVNSLIKSLNPSYITNQYPYAFPKSLPSNAVEPTLFNRGVMYSYPEPVPTATPKNTKYPIVEYAPNPTSMGNSVNADRLPLGAQFFHIDPKSIAADAKYPLAKYMSPSISADMLLASAKPTFNPDGSYSPRGTSRVSLGNIAKGVLGITGLAAIADAVYNKDESALAYLLGMGPGSLVASTPLNAGENEQLAFMERQRAAEQAHQLEPVVNRLEQQVSQLKPLVDPDDLLNEAIKYRKLNNAIKKGATIEPQEYPQIALQGTGDTDDAEETSIDETPTKKSAGEITPSSVEVNTKTYDANGNLVSGSDPKVNTSKNTQKTLGTTPQGSGYITNEDKTVTVGDAKVPAKTTTSNPPADATTVPAPAKTNSSAPAKQSNFTRQRNRTSLLSTPELTRAILNNEFGNGKERRDNLLAQGYSPEQIQAAQDQINKMMRPVRRGASRAPVQQRHVSPTLAEAVIYNRPDTLPVQTPVTRPNTNASGYTKGHEAVFNPRTGRLEFI